MSNNLLETVTAAFGDEIINQASPFLGESEKRVRSALGMLLPTLLGGLAKQGSTVEGASRLIKTLSGTEIDSGLYADLAGLFSGGDRTDSLLEFGSSLSTTMFGAKMDSLLATVASMTGIKTSSASSLLAMAAPLVFGYLKKLVGDRGLDAAGLMRLLSDQKGFLWGKVDDRIMRALGLGSFFHEPVTAAPGTFRRTERSDAVRDRDDTAVWAKLWPWLLVLAGLVAAAGLFRSCQKVEQTAVAPASVEVPDSDVTPAPAVVPAAALPANIYFNVGAAAIGADGRKTIADVVSVVKNQGLNVVLTGYTDKTGDVGKNIQLAKQRALAVRDALINAGVAASQIVMKPPSTMTTTGTGSDAAARRVEISRAN